MILINICKSYLILPLFLMFQNCNSTTKTVVNETKTKQESNVIQVGADQMAEYLPMIEGKNVALVVNQTSMIGDVHLVDYLYKNAVSSKIKRIFAPEHGFRGSADAGEHVADGKDISTGLPIKSLYGANKKPSKEDLADVDVVIFDIQDIGARFYTYISTMHYVMDACSMYHKKLIILDRPNPNGHYVDGPILDKKVQSFVGLDEIPIVHGMTVGELAMMINGEKWLESKQKCDISIIKCLNYNHSTSRYVLPVATSPNIKTMRAVYMYPSLCLFEGTEVSVGRGTESPFEMWGSPFFKNGTTTFTPKPGPGSKDPFQNGKTCNGFDVCKKDIKSLENFFLANHFFDKLAGNDKLRQQIIDGVSETVIRESWEPNLSNFKLKRKQYLLYSE
jgi:uncharacterized protein YbbC (DUF1343 family)